jgi:Malonyl-CoA decarboxylase C-terminal domain
MLQEEFPSLTTFVTLSPLPSFRSWLETTLARELELELELESLSNNGGGGTNDKDTTATIMPLLSRDDWLRLKESGLTKLRNGATTTGMTSTTTTTSLEDLDLLLQRLDQEYLLQHSEQEIDGTNDEETNSLSTFWSEHRHVLDPIFSKLVARYIVLETQVTQHPPGTDRHGQLATTSGRPLDAVARFHLGNGAQFFRINIAANLMEEEEEEDVPPPSHDDKPLSQYHSDSLERNVSTRHIHRRSPGSSHLSWQQSWGIMVNYRYNLSWLPQNQQHYKECGRHSTTEGESEAKGRIPVSRHIVPWIPPQLATMAIWEQNPTSTARSGTTAFNHST